MTSIWRSTGLHATEANRSRAEDMLEETRMRIAYDPAVFAPIVTPVTYSAHMGVKRHLFTLDFHAKANGAFAAKFLVTPVSQKEG